MPQRFMLTVGLKGANGKRRTKSYDMGVFDVSGTEGDEYEAAVSAADQIMGALDAVTDAAICDFNLSCTENATLGANTTTALGTGDVFEKALLNLALLNNDDEVEPGLVGQSYINAPVIGIFMGASGADRDIIDRADSDLQQYVQQLEQHTVLSDGQHIDAAQNLNGLLGGRRISTPI